MALDINIKKKKEIKENPLDINKVFPGYINKWVFRGVIGVMLLFTYFVFVSNGTLFFNYVECPIDAQSGRCDNSNYDAFAPSDSCLSVHYLEAGESCGTKPNYWAQHYNKICLLLVVLSFLVNHLFYFFKTGNKKIPFDKDAWNKHPLSRLSKLKIDEED